MSAAARQKLEPFYFYFDSAAVEGKFGEIIRQNFDFREIPAVQRGNC